MLTTRSCLDHDARYSHTPGAVTRTDSLGRTMTLDAIRLLVDLDTGLVAHGHDGEVAPVFERLCDGYTAAGCGDRLDRLVMFTLDADDSAHLRINRAIENPRFARMLARKVLGAHDITPPAESVDRPGAAALN